MSEANEVREYNFQVGDKVRFKTWERMEAEYGLDESGDINCRRIFVSQMDETISRDRIFTIRSIDEDRVKFEEEPADGYYAYSVDMIQPAYEETEVQNTFPYDWSWVDYPEGIKTRTLSSSSSLNFIGAIVTLCLDRTMSVEMRKGNYDYDTFFGYLNSLEVNGAIYLAICSTTPSQMEYFTDTISVAQQSNGRILFVAQKEQDYYEPGVPEKIFTFLCEQFPVEESGSTLTTIREYVIAGKVDEGVTLRKQYLTTAEMIKQKRKMRDTLSNLSDELGKSQQAALEKQVASCEENYNGAVNAIDRYWESLQKARKELCFYINNDHKESELIPLLRQEIEAGNLLEMQVSRQSLMVNIKQDLLFFNEEDWPVIRNGVLSSSRAQRWAPVIDAIMSRKCICTLEQKVWIYFGSPNVERCTSSTRKVGLPNPHIERYDCWDQNKPLITRYLREGNYEQAYIQIKSAIAGINITDNPVMVQFCQYFSMYSNIECITDAETGEVMSIEKANEYYKEEA